MHSFLQVTVFGSHFNTYRENRILCRFRFVSGAGNVDVDVDALVLDDSRLQCTTPPAALSGTEASVTLSVDGSSFCVDGFKADLEGNLVEYNKVKFYYTLGSTQPVPNIAWNAPLMQWKMCVYNASAPPGSRSVDSYASRPGIDFTYNAAEDPVPETPSRDCSQLPNSAVEVAGMGWFGCLSLHDDWKVHDGADPQWCARALPANGGTTYIFYLYDPFHSVTGYMERPVPFNFPGTCNRIPSSESIRVQIKWSNVLEVVPKPGRTVEEQWNTLEPAVKADVSGRPYLLDTNVYLRGTASNREAHVDWEVSTQLHNKDAVLDMLEGMRQQVAQGKRIRGQYEASLLTLGSVKVLRMDEPGLTEEGRLTGWDLQLDYRVSDVHSREYDFRLSPESQRLNTTKGKLCVLCGVIAPHVGSSGDFSLNYFKQTYRQANSSSMRYFHTKLLAMRTAGTLATCDRLRERHACKVCEKSKFASVCSTLRQLELNFDSCKPCCTGFAQPGREVRICGRSVQLLH